MSHVTQRYQTPLDERQIFSNQMSESRFVDHSWRMESETLVEKERAREKRAARLNRFFKTTIVVLLGILAVEVVFNFFIEPKMVISKVKITANEGIALTNSQILELAGFSGTLSYLDVDTRKAEASLARVPLIRSASVEKHFPDTLTIRIERREPLGVVLEEKGGQTVPLVFDRDGMIFDVGASPFLGDLPVVSGIKFPELRPGVRLPDTLLPFLTDLSVMKEKSGSLFGLISELKFVKKNTNDYEVLLFPRQFRTRVRIGSRIDDNLMKNILLVLDMVTRENMAPSLEELDFRSSKIVYRTREE